MRLKSLIKSLLVVLLLVLSATPVKAAAVGTEFLYQGALTANGSPANGAYEMIFALFRQGETNPVSSVSNNNVTVSLGLFTVRLDFGAGVFDGTAYELGIAVRQQGSGGPFVPLMPRQPLTATPNSLHAETVRSVPDSALSGNVPLLNGSPMFSTPVSVTMFRVAEASGAGVLKFGPTDDCTIGVTPQGPAGLLLRDPKGVRILSPNPAFSPTLRFGPTDDCSIGIDPAFPGLVERDPIGFRLLGLNNQGCRLIFGPTMDCTVEVNPAGPQGLLLRDPRGVRVLSPSATNPPTLRFGPTDDCSIGIDPAFPGLVERDPIGFRLLGRTNQGCRLIFGPTMNCTVEVDPAGPAGLLLRDPSGIRILSPDAQRPPRLRFGPTDDCSIGIDPALTGLIVLDPFGLRLAPPGSASPTLRFGPTDDCSIGVASGLSGLLLRDPSGVRIAPAADNALPTLRFGPTDDCSIGIDPAFPGLVERDAIGFRLLGQNNQGGRLIFGPTMNCTIELQPPTSNSIAGLLLRDPKGIRILTPSPGGTNTLLFGPTDNCRISAPGPNGGLGFSDPQGFTFGSQVTVNGPVFAQAFIQTSSRRFKNDVKPIEQPLEKIAKLQGVRFTWNKEQGGRQDIGFIAEEVGKVIPEVVSWEEDGQNARGVNYDHLVAVAIEGIKAQQTKIETLEREKTELKQSLASMQEQLDRLARKLETVTAR